MNVKCPNCRFKFDVNPTDVNEQNEVNCTCPRCGKAFISQYIAPVTEHPAEAPIQQPSPSAAPTSPAISQEQETDLYYAVMKRMKAGQHEEAGIYLEKLLALKPNEPMYLDIKKQLDGIKQSYLLANKYIRTGNWNLARLYINDLLKANPNEPMYLSLQDELFEAQRQEAQRQEAQRQEEEERKKQEALLKAQKEKEALIEAQKERDKRTKEIMPPMMKVTMGICAIITSLYLLIDYYTWLLQCGSPVLNGIFKFTYLALSICFIVHLICAHIITRGENTKIKSNILIPLWINFIWFIVSLFRPTWYPYPCLNVFLCIGALLVFGLAAVIATWYYCSYGFWSVYQSIRIEEQEKSMNQKKIARWWATIVVIMVLLLLLIIHW